MDDHTPVEQIIQSLLFEIEAIPKTITEESTSVSKVTPLNVKIRVRKKNDLSMHQDIISVPKFSDPEKVSRTIHLVNSDQTIISFDVFMEEDISKKPVRKTRKHLLEILRTGVCLGASDDDSYPYLPTSLYSANIIDDATNSKSDGVIKQKFTLSNNTYEKVPIKRKNFLGKCKPGGCLDPPFGDDIYSYTRSSQDETNSEKNRTKEVHKADSIMIFKEKLSSIFDYSIFKKQRKTSHKTNVTKGFTISNSILSLYQVESCVDSLSTNQSNSIITYPSMLAPNEPSIDEEKNKSRASSEDKSMKSYNEYRNLLTADTYFIPAKDIHKVKNRNHDISTYFGDDQSKSFEISKIPVYTPTLEHIESDIKHKETKLKIENLNVQKIEKSKYNEETTLNNIERRDEKPFMEVKLSVSQNMEVQNNILNTDWSSDTKYLQYSKKIEEEQLMNFSSIGELRSKPNDNSFLSQVINIPEIPSTVAPTDDNIKVIDSIKKATDSHRSKAISLDEILDKHENTTVKTEMDRYGTQNIFLLKIPEKNVSQKVCTKSTNHLILPIEQEESFNLVDVTHNDNEIVSHPKTTEDTKNSKYANNAINIDLINNARCSDNDLISSVKSLHNTITKYRDQQQSKTLEDMFNIPNTMLTKNEYYIAAQITEDQILGSIESERNLANDRGYNIENKECFDNNKIVLKNPLRSRSTDFEDIDHSITPIKQSTKNKIISKTSIYYFELENRCSFNAFLKPNNDNLLPKTSLSCDTELKDTHRYGSVTSAVEKNKDKLSLKTSLKSSTELGSRIGSNTLILESRKDDSLLKTRSSLELENRYISLNSYDKLNKDTTHRAGTESEDKYDFNTSVVESTKDKLKSNTELEDEYDSKFLLSSTVKTTIAEIETLETVLTSDDTGLETYNSSTSVVNSTKEEIEFITESRFKETTLKNSYDFNNKILVSNINKIYLKTPSTSVEKSINGEIVLPALRYNEIDGDTNNISNFIVKFSNGEKALKSSAKSEETNLRDSKDSSTSFVSNKDKILKLEVSNRSSNPILKAPIDKLLKTSKFNTELEDQDYLKTLNEIALKAPSKSLETQSEHAYNFITLDAKSIKDETALKTASKCKDTYLEDCYSSNGLKENLTLDEIKFNTSLKYDNKLENEYISRTSFRQSSKNEKALKTGLRPSNTDSNDNVSSCTLTVMKDDSKDEAVLETNPRSNEKENSFRSDTLNIKLSKTLLKMDMELKDSSTSVVKSTKGKITYNNASISGSNEIIDNYCSSTLIEDAIKDETDLGCNGIDHEVNVMSSNKQIVIPLFTELPQNNIKFPDLSDEYEVPTCGHFSKKLRNTSISSSFPSTSASESILKSETVKIDMGFKTYLNERNERVFKTFDTKLDPKRHHNDSLTMVKSQLRLSSSGIKIPIDTENDMAIHIKITNINQHEHVCKIDFKTWVHSITKQQAVQTSDSKCKLNVIGRELLHETLQKIYDQELVPLQMNIKTLKEEIDALASQQIFLTEKIYCPKKYKPPRVGHINKKCGCLKRI